MSILGKLLKTAIDVATLPVSVAADVVTLGGATGDRHEPYTASHLKCLVKDGVQIYEEVEKL